MSPWIVRWGAPAAAVLVLMACGARKDDTGDLRNAGADGLAVTLDDEGFERAPEVHFSAPGTTRFGGGHLLCRERRSEISAELANELGFDVVGDRAVLEASQALDVIASWNDVRPTTVHYRGRIVRIIRVDRQPPVDWSVEEAVPVGCPSGVEYDLVQQLYTEDGAVRGAFLAHVPATQLGEPTARQLASDVDLRNFTGDLPVGWIDAAEPSFAAVSVSAWVCRNTRRVELEAANQRTSIAAAPDAHATRRAVNPARTTSAPTTWCCRPSAWAATKLTPTSPSCGSASS